MKKRLITIITLILSLIFSMSIFAFGCNGSDKKESGKDKEKDKPSGYIEDPSDYEFNYDYFFGMCDPSGSLAGGVDKAITNEWLGDVADVCGIQSFRIWVSLDGRSSGLINVDSDNNLSFNKAYLDKVHDYVDNLIRGGVKNILFLNTCNIYPYGSSYIGFDIPDVNEDEEEYFEFLKIMAKAYGLLAREFPEITNWETGNEPDLDGAGMHKHGYQHGASEAINSQYLYNNVEMAEIICDMSWYIRREVKAVSEKNRVALPALSLAYDTDHSFFEGIYEAIESRKLPYGTEKSDIDPDNYFDIIDYHPYINAGGLGGSFNFSDDDWEDWAEIQFEIHDIAKKHGDEKKATYFSEMGWTDYGHEYNGVDQNQIADNYIIAMDIIKEQMPWVEVVYCFRATTLIYQKASDNQTEENFGIFYNQADPVHGGKAKPAAKRLAEYFNCSGSEHFKDFDWFEDKYKTSHVK